MKFASPMDYSELTPSKHTIWNDVEGELVLFDSRDGSYHALNEVGSYIWRNIAHGRELSLIIQDLHNQYQQDETAIRADVQLFLSDALAKGLLHFKAAPL
jgi:Coenzyme PQQ synthesis protein D (PqqD)